MKNVLLDLAEKMRKNGHWFDESNEMERMEQCYRAADILTELAKVEQGEASPTPWRKHTDREVRANDNRLWIEDVVCQTQSCPKTRYTKKDREEWDIPATANTELIVASVNAIARCRELAQGKE